MDERGSFVHCSIESPDRIRREIYFDTFMVIFVPIAILTPQSKTLYDSITTCAYIATLHHSLKLWPLIWVKKKEPMKRDNDINNSRTDSNIGGNKNATQRHFWYLSIISAFDSSPTISSPWSSGNNTNSCWRKVIISIILAYSRNSKVTEYWLLLEFSMLTFSDRTIINKCRS